MKGLNKWIWQESTKTVRTEPEHYCVVTVDSFCASGSTDGALDRDRVANLIAAAPEMLEALELIADATNNLLQNIYDAGEGEHPETGEPLPDVDMLEKALMETNKAIAKAKGET